MKSVLTLDQGTTGSTALVVGEDGSILGRAYSEFTQHFPRPGWVEHDPAEIWDVTRKVAREALERSSARPEVLGITNQRETVVVWDRSTGKPLHRAIVWQDRRTAARCRELKRRPGAAFLAERTGLTWDPYFSGTKIEWLLEHVPGLRERAEGGDAVFGTIDSWLVWNLTDGASFVTDHTNASRTMLYHIRKRRWDPELMSMFGVPVHSLPELVDSSGIVGDIPGDLLGHEMRVAGMAGDQQAALYGQGCWAPGRAKCTYGTGAFLLLPVTEHVGGLTLESGLLTTIGCDAEGAPMFAVEGSVFIAGAAVQWLRDGLGLISSAAETEELARSLSSSEGVYFVPAFVGLGAPHWESEARGTIVGISRGTTSAHLARAALESMAFSTRELVEAVAERMGLRLEELRVDGGAAANDWLMQFQADTLGVPVSRPDQVETTALGAAGLAGVAGGVWSSSEEFMSMREYVQFRPQASRDLEFAGWHRAVAAALHWARDHDS